MPFMYISLAISLLLLSCTTSSLAQSSTPASDDAPQCPSHTTDTIVYHTAEHRYSEDATTTAELQQHNELYPFTFLSLGDWGQLNNDLRAVAKQIDVTAQQYNATFLINTGDNFYENGVESVNDSQWRTTYEEQFDGNALQIPWYSVQGNHDHHWGRGGAEIEYSTVNCDHRWTMPYYYYFKQLRVLPTSSDEQQSAEPITLDVTFIDTWILTEPDFDNGTAITEEQREGHWQWIDESLQKSMNNSYGVTPHWRMVVGHYPVFSGGEHGDTSPLVIRLQPMLAKYNVDIYINGHDHTLQHLQDTHNTNYYVSGNGAKRGTYVTTRQTVWGVVDPGFMVHSMNTTHMLTQVIDREAKVVYTTTQQSKASQQPKQVVLQPSDWMSLIRSIGSKLAVRAPLQWNQN